MFQEIQKTQIPFVKEICVVKFKYTILGWN